MTDSDKNDDIVLSREIQDFVSSKQLRAAFKAYRERCKDKDQMRTIPGLCRALNISREEYIKFRNSDEFRKDFEQVELAMEHEWLQKLRSPNNSGAIFYLKNAYREYYKEVEQPRNPINIIFNADQLNLIARRTLSNSKSGERTFDRLRDSDQSEISTELSS